MASLNKSLIIGNLSKNPELRAFPNGTLMTTFTVITTESWKAGKDGEIKSKTEWHRIVCFDKLAEIAEKCFKKGDQVYIEGKISTRKYKHKDGSDRYITEIVPDVAQKLGKKTDTEEARVSNEAEAPVSDETEDYPPVADYGDDAPF